MAVSEIESDFSTNTDSGEEAELDTTVTLDSDKDESVD